MLIKEWQLNKKLKTTLPTHPERKTFGLISFLVPVISRETLPLKAVLRQRKIRLPKLIFINTKLSYVCSTSINNKPMTTIHCSKNFRRFSKNKESS